MTLPPPHEKTNELPASSAATHETISGQLVFLGTGTSHGVPVIGCSCAVCRSSDPRDQRTRCSVVAGLPDGNLLIDSPPELRLQLLREGIGRIDAVVYTHEHADHLFGLDDLRIFPQYLGADLPVYCSLRVEQRIRKAFDYAFDPAVQSFPAGGLPKLDFRRIDSAPFDVLGARIVPIPLEHGPYEVMGFRIGDVAYCTDVNAIPPSSMELLGGLRVLVLDALRRRQHPTHFSLAEALEVSARLRPKTTYFTHLSHDLPHEATLAELPPGVFLAYDGLRIALQP